MRYAIENTEAFQILARRAAERDALYALQKSEARHAAAPVQAGLIRSGLERVARLLGWVQVTAHAGKH